MKCHSYAWPAAPLQSQWKREVNALQCEIRKPVKCGCIASDEVSTKWSSQLRDILVKFSKFGIWSDFLGNTFAHVRRHAISAITRSSIVFKQTARSSAMEIHINGAFLCDTHFVATKHSFVKHIRISVCEYGSTIKCALMCSSLDSFASCQRSCEVKTHAPPFTDMTNNNSAHSIRIYPT